MAISKFSLVKILEFVLAAICLGLHIHSFHGTQANLVVCSATFGGYVIITAGILIGHLGNTPVNRRIDIYFCLAAVILFIASGSMAIDFYKDQGKTDERTYGLSKAAIAIINGVIFLVDAVFVYRGE